MNIAVFGWYHHRNAGDDRIQYCISRWLDGHTLAFLPAGRKPPVQMLRTYDAVIIGGGGLIMNEGGVFRQMARWVRAVGVPVALVGVSVERLTPALRQELREFLDLCCFAWFRDRGSLEEIGAHERAFVAPDLTWLYPFPKLPDASVESIALNLRKQASLPLSEWKKALAQLDERIEAWPLYFERGGDATVLERVLTSSAAPEEFTLAPLRSAETVISGRFHGVHFALQCGRPVIAVSSLPKTRRFLSEHGLGQWCISEDEPQRLKETLRRLQERRGEVSDKIAALRSALHKQAARQAATSREMLLHAAQSLPPSSRRLGYRLREALDLGSYF